MKKRGPEGVLALMTAWTGPDSLVGDPEPMSPAELTAFEAAIGVALSPSLHAILSWDAGWFRRTYGWQTDAPAPAAIDLIEGFCPPFAPAFEPLCSRRLPGRALPLDGGSESLRFVYFGDPDAFGEYPVLWLDVDDLPSLGVQAGGIDVYLAQQLGALGPRAHADAVKLACKRLFGRSTPLELYALPGRLPSPVPGPAPGSVAHAAVVVPPSKPRRLSDAALAKALAEKVGNPRRLAELVADALARGIGGLDAALVAAALGGPLASVALLLEAGASPNARDASGCALARSVYNPDDAVHDALLAAGANPDGPSILGRTALFESVIEGQVGRVRASLAAGAHPNRQDQYKLTPLHHAVSRSPTAGIPPVAVLEALLEAGADPNLGPALLVVAIEGGSAPHVAALVRAGASLSATSVYLSRTPLHAAFDGCRDELAPLLIAAGADRHAVDERGITLSAVYGERGEDVRPVHLALHPGQRCRHTLRLRLMVTNPFHAHTVRPPALQLATWRDLGALGLCGGGLLESLEELPIDGLDRPGEHELSAQFTGTLTAELLARMVASMLGPWGNLPTGVHVDPVVRVVGISLVDDGQGAPLGSLPSVKRHPRARRIREGSPGIRVQLKEPVSTIQLSALEAAIRGWEGAAFAWRRGPSQAAWMLAPAAATADGSTVWMGLLEVSGSRPKPPWPFEDADTLPDLDDVLAAYEPVDVALTAP